MLRNTEPGTPTCPTPHPSPPRRRGRPPRSIHHQRSSNHPPHSRYPTTPSAPSPRPPAPSTSPPPPASNATNPTTTPTAPSQPPRCVFTAPAPAPNSGSLLLLSYSLLQRTNKSPPRPHHSSNRDSSCHQHAFSVHYLGKPRNPIPNAHPPPHTPSPAPPLTSHCSPLTPRLASRPVTARPLPISLLCPLPSPLPPLVIPASSAGTQHLDQSHRTHATPGNPA